MSQRASDALFTGIADRIMTELQRLELKDARILLKILTDSLEFIHEMNVEQEESK